MLFAGGLVMMATSTRVTAYLQAFGASNAELWGGIGRIVGPMLIAFAMFEYPPRKPEPDDGRLRTDWTQLVIPHVGFLGITALFAYHALHDRPWHPFIIAALVLMVVLVTSRQIIAMRAQRLLTQRLNWAQLPERTLVAGEALARWTAPNGMQVPPETFVGTAESAGLGAALDALILERVVDEVESAGLAVDIHVNIGAARLGNPDFERNVRGTLERHRISSDRLVVEITETAPIVDLSDAAAQITRLKAAGVKVALDDFGTGYNSLTYLHTLPVSMVKLDRILAVGTDPDRDLALYRSVIGLCESLGLSVAAEGIETPDQADAVLSAGCHLMQGYLFGPPAPLSELVGDWAPAARSYRS
ncbi:hypothetical protein A5757_04180 [Mycobacterium sp. 852013-51886_SCH5428379]|uniref:EAL domain-containing protein n=1 Tax=Mycobacterium sp. 852013-51886_SCH5428379 TaxID=1834111 RepID=UPI0007FBDF46|nr:EAL domain-containing protein [Mycobacterium sp. 852013-51886_SCH5428379]OBB55697.1 hypothetical protein A5757_04180 [Mycobacterium sp. 852013-51886_SCH5428379]